VTSGALGVKSATGFGEEEGPVRHMKLCCLLLGLALIPPRSQAGTILITEQEASLPNAHGGPVSRGITRGPSVELVQPAETAHSPVHFQIRFQAFGGNKINLETLRVSYLKTPEIDLVPRLMRFVQRSGIDIPDAELPPGEHSFRIEVSDTEGRTRSSVFAFKVVP
jgi:hypothetical protein